MYVTRDRPRNSPSYAWRSPSSRCKMGSSWAALLNCHGDKSLVTLQYTKSLQWRNHHFEWVNQLQMGGCSIAMVNYQRVILVCWIHCACGNTWSINIGWLCAIVYGCFGKCTEIQLPWYWTPALHGPKYVISSLAKPRFQRGYLDIRERDYKP